MPITRNYIFIILIVLITLCLTFLTSKEGLTNNKFSGICKKITRRGKSVFLISIFYVINSVCSRL